MLIQSPSGNSKQTISLRIHTRKTKKYPKDPTLIYGREKETNSASDNIANLDIFTLMQYCDEKHNGGMNMMDIVRVLLLTLSKEISPEEIIMALETDTSYYFSDIYTKENMLSETKLPFMNNDDEANEELKLYSELIRQMTEKIDKEKYLDGKIFKEDESKYLNAYYNTLAKHECKSRDNPPSIPKHKIVKENTPPIEDEIKREPKDFEKEVKSTALDVVNISITALMENLDTDEFSYVVASGIQNDSAQENRVKSNNSGTIEAKEAHNNTFSKIQVENLLNSVDVATSHLSSGELDKVAKQLSEYIQKRAKSITVKYINEREF